jgi:hypothetical protein
VSTGYGTNHLSQLLSWRQTQSYWYHWLMATTRGERLVRGDRRAFTRHIWDEWFVAYRPDDAEFERTAISFDNPDSGHHATRTARAGPRARHPAYAEPKRASIRAQAARAPTLTLHGALDPVNLP